MSDAPSVYSLIAEGLLSIAAQPEDNQVAYLDYPAYTLPLIQHDYAAKTALMWNAAYRRFGFEVANCMLLADPIHLPRIFEVFRNDVKYLGGGVGVGFKEIAFQHVDEYKPDVEHLRSVNFLVKTKGGHLRGYNTDGAGYADSLEEAFAKTGGTMRSKRILLLGAGGTSRAVAFALGARGCQIQIANRSFARAHEICEQLNQFFAAGIATAFDDSAIADAVRDCDAIVNVSSVGSSGPLEAYSPLAPSVLPPTRGNIERNQSAADEVMDRIPNSTIISDVVITPEGTPLLRTAKRKGFVVLDGIPMVVNQAVQSFWILHGDELRRRYISRAQLATVMNDAATDYGTTRVKSPV